MLDDKLKAGLNVAFNEADLLGIELDPEKRTVAATFRVLTLPEAGPAQSDRRVQILLYPIGRVAVSLRNARWDDDSAVAEPLSLADLLPTVQSFGSLPIYGWDFFDVHERNMTKWGNRLSLDWRSEPHGTSHSFTVFQEPGDRILDVCIWFDELEIRDPNGTAIPLQAFIAAGKRWWDALYSGDERAKGYGIIPA